MRVPSLDNDFPPRRLMTLTVLAILAAGVVGQEAALSQATDGADVWVCELDTTTGRSRRLFAAADLKDLGSACYSPDGSRIAFDGLLPGRLGSSTSHVFVCRLDGSDRVDLGPGLLPSWSPRGRRLCLSRNSPEYGVWLMNADGSDAELLDNRGWGARWSPDGRRIDYVRDVNGRPNLISWNLVEDERTARFQPWPTPVQTPAAEQRITGRPAFAPDSRQLGFRLTQAGTHTLLLVDATGQLTERLPHEHLQPDPAWLDDDRLVVTIGAAAPYRNQLYVLEARGTGAPQPLAGQLPQRSNSHPSVSRDGRRVLYLSRPQR